MKLQKSKRLWGESHFPIKTISELEKLSRSLRWQWFERLVAFVFEQNDFAINEKRVIIFDTTKRQYDIIAEKYGKIWLIECKKQKNLNINHAIIKHKERCEMYNKKTGKIIEPLIVTMDQELEAEIPVVPLLKLNTFINEY